MQRGNTPSMKIQAKLMFSSSDLVLFILEAKYSIDAHEIWLLPLMFYSTWSPNLRSQVVDLFHLRCAENSSIC